MIPKIDIIRCTHENADHLQPGEWFNLDDVPQHVVTCEQFRCIDCGAWLSLGPSNDRIPAREKRLAAGIAGIVILWPLGSGRDDEIDSLAEFWSEH